jgi:hypothetical protein
MKAGNTRRLFEQRPPRLRLGGDQLADLALPNEGRGVGAGRGVGEQQLHIAGPDFAPVDPIHRAFFTLDPAGDFQDVGIVERGRRRAVAVVEHQRNFGVVARRPVAPAGENDVVHARGAHRLVRAFAHYPAQRFDEIGFTAAVRPHHAGKPGFEVELGEVGEGFKAVELEALELHGALLATMKPRVNP